MKQILCGDIEKKYCICLLNGRNYDSQYREESYENLPGKPSSPGTPLRPGVPGRPSGPLRPGRPLPPGRPIPPFSPTDTTSHQVVCQQKCNRTIHKILTQHTRRLNFTRSLNPTHLRLFFSAWIVFYGVKTQTRYLLLNRFSLQLFFFLIFLAGCMQQTKLAAFQLT